MSLAFLLYYNWRRCYYRKPSLQCLHSTGSIIDVPVHVQIMCIDIHTPYHAPELLLIGMFYYMLGNLRPELRSTQRSIQLIACVTSKNLEAYGFAAVLDPFIKDVNILENVMLYLAIAYYLSHSIHLQKGFDIEVDGRVCHIHGTLLVMLADTLAAHQLGGFKIGVGFALRKCRQCMATHDDMQMKVYLQ